MIYETLGSGLYVVTVDKSCDRAKGSGKEDRKEFLVQMPRKLIMLLHSQRFHRRPSAMTILMLNGY